MLMLFPPLWLAAVVLFLMWFGLRPMILLAQNPLDPLVLAIIF